MITETGVDRLVSPATVVRTVAGRVLLQRPEGEAWASLALAYPYEPVPNDVVLTIGESEVYIIGVLLGRGRSRFVAPGDLEIRAQGRLELYGDAGISLRGPDVTVRTDRFEIFAKTLFEKLLNGYRWIRDTIETRCGRSRTLVDGSCTTTAERVVMHAEKDVKIDGRQIHLG